LSIATTAQTGALAPLRHPASQRGLRDGATTLAFLAGGVLWLFRRGKNRRWPLMLPVVVGWLAFATILSGCGGSKSNSSSQPETAIITVAATAGSETQSATYTLTVQ
jgi:hypothetical protein